MSEAMRGGGAYDDHSDHQLHDAEAQASLVAAAAARVSSEVSEGPVIIADYGCAQGRVSNTLVRRAIEPIRERNPDVPIMVFHNDVLGNDWAGLFANLADENGYLDVPGGPITPMTSANSFFELVVPPGLVDLGVSFAAAQWLAASGPAGTGSALYFDQLEGDHRAAMAEQAHADWTRFLSRRAEELAPHGRLIVSMMGAETDGAAAGHDVWRHVRVIADELTREGALDGGLVDAFVFPVYERTLEEVRRPFTEALGERLALERSTIVASPSPAQVRYRETGDADEFATAFTGFFRAFSEPSLRVGIDPSNHALDELYRRLHRRLASNAENFDFSVKVVSLVISKRD